MMKKIWALVFCFALSCRAQVLDVNGDDTVGAEEALAVAASWKGTPATPNNHNHLGQTWIGDKNAFSIRGNFPDRDRVIIIPGKEKGIGVDRIPQAPLILENTGISQIGGSNEFGADLILGGLRGIVAANEDGGSGLFLESNKDITFHLDKDNNDPSFLEVRNGADTSIFFLDESGNLTIQGFLLKSQSATRIDHPLDPKGKYLIHSPVESPEMKNVYDGVARLDSGGAAWVHLPEYFEAFNSDFRYQLTCIGGFAPIYVAEEIQDNQFKIAGGLPGMKVSWMVTGVRRDAYAENHPLEVEQEKTVGEKRRRPHPEILGEPRVKQVKKAE